MRTLNGRPVRREAVLPGAVLARIASSHLRVGTFQYARSTGDIDLPWASDERVG